VDACSFVWAMMESAFGYNTSMPNLYMSLISFTGTWADMGYLGIVVVEQRR